MDSQCRVNNWTQYLVKVCATLVTLVTNHGSVLNYISPVKSIFKLKLDNHE